MMTLRVFKNRAFARWVKGNDLGDGSLCRAAHEVRRGLIDARLGGPLLKKRVGRLHGGKRGGFRTIIAYQESDRLFFIYGFAKNERDNITNTERMVLMALGEQFMACDDAALARAITDGLLQEVACDG
ncbi:type II toxin-antitoxin system RelE/ParE family toxin [Dongia sp.]|uniref:type II toxin-antitoxin system RelE/ParE family toxin n=1 Tax=Dongia sp. TaxID=1977262 RepID=UPI0035B1F87E